MARTKCLGLLRALPVRGCAQLRIEFREAVNVELQ